MCVLPMGATRVLLICIACVDHVLDLVSNQVIVQIHKGSNDFQDIAHFLFHGNGNYVFKNFEYFHPADDSLDMDADISYTPGSCDFSP